MEFRYHGFLVSGNKRNEKTRRGFKHTDRYNYFLADVEKQWRKKYGFKIKPVEWIICMDVIIYRGKKIGDRSNYLKTIEDSLIGLAYRDDKQIKDGRTQMIDGESPGFFIKISLIPKSEILQKENIAQSKKPGKKNKKSISNLAIQTTADTV